MFYFDKFISGAQPPAQPDTETTIRLADPLDAMSANRQQTHVVVAGSRGVLQILKLLYHKNEGDVPEAPKIVRDVDLRSYRRGKVNILYSANNVSWNQLKEQIVATTSPNGSIVLWNVHRKNVKENIYKSHERTATCLSWHRDNENLLVSGSRDCTVLLYDIRTPDKHIKAYTEETCEAVRDIVFSPNSGQYDLFFTGDDSGAIRLWDLRYGKTPVIRNTAHHSVVSSIAFNTEDRTRLATAGGRDRCIRIWNFISSRLDKVFRIETNSPLGKVSWRPHRPEQIVSCASINDTNVHVWDMRRPYLPYASFDDHKDSVTDMFWPKDHHDRFVTCGKDGSIIIHDIEERRSILGYACDVPFDFSADGKIVTAASERMTKSYSKKFDPYPGCHAPREDKLEKFLRSHFETPLESISYGYFTKTVQSVLTCGTPRQVDPTTNFEIFKYFAKRYRLGGRYRIVDMCYYNAKVAAEVGYYPIEAKWKQVASCVERTVLQSVSGPFNMQMMRVFQSYDKKKKHEEELFRKQMDIRKDELIEEGKWPGDSLREKYGWNKCFTRPKKPGTDRHRVDHFQQKVIDDLLYEVNSKETWAYRVFGKAEDIDLPEMREVRQRKKLEQKTSVAKKNDLVEFLKTTAVRDEVMSLCDDICFWEPQARGDVNVCVGKIDHSESRRLMESIHKIIKERVFEGDIQTAVSMCCVIGSALLHVLSPYTVEAWAESYIEMLSESQEYVAMARVKKHIFVQRIRDATFQDATIEMVHRKCDGRILNGMCQGCGLHLILECCVCYMIIPDMFYQCRTCFHTMHIDHAADWFKYNQYCPSQDCLCNCVRKTYPWDNWEGYKAPKGQTAEQCSVDILANYPRTPKIVTKLNKRKEWRWYRRMFKTKQAELKQLLNRCNTKNTQRLKEFICVHPRIPWTEVAHGHDVDLNRRVHDLWMNFVLKRERICNKHFGQLIYSYYGKEVGQGISDLLWERRGIYLKTIQDEPLSIFDDSDSENEGTELPTCFVASDEKRRRNKMMRKAEEEAVLIDLKPCHGNKDEYRPRNVPILTRRPDLSRKSRSRSCHYLVVHDVDRSEKYRLKMKRDGSVRYRGTEDPAYSIRPFQYFRSYLHGMSQKNYPYFKLVRNEEDGVILCRVLGTIIEENAACLEVDAFTDEDLKNKNLRIYKRKVLRKHRQQMEKVLANTKRYMIEKRLIRKHYEQPEGVNFDKTEKMMIGLKIALGNAAAMLEEDAALFHKIVEQKKIRFRRKFHKLRRKVEDSAKREPQPVYIPKTDEPEDETSSVFSYEEDMTDIDVLSAEHVIRQLVHEMVNNIVEKVDGDDMTVDGVSSIEEDIPYDDKSSVAPRPTLTLPLLNPLQVFSHRTNDSFASGSRSDLTEIDTEERQNAVSPMCFHPVQTPVHIPREQSPMMLESELESFCLTEDKPDEPVVIRRRRRRRERFDKTNTTIISVEKGFVKDEDGQTIRFGGPSSDEEDESSQEDEEEVPVDVMVTSAAKDREFAKGCLLPTELVERHMLVDRACGVFGKDKNYFDLQIMLDLPLKRAPHVTEQVEKEPLEFDDTRVFMDPEIEAVKTWKNARKLQQEALEFWSSAREENDQQGMCPELHSLIRDMHRMELLKLANVQKQKVVAKIEKSIRNPDNTDYLLANLSNEKYLKRLLTKGILKENKLKGKLETFEAVKRYLSTLIPVEGLYIRLPVPTSSSRILAYHFTKYTAGHRVTKGNVVIKKNTRSITDFYVYDEANNFFYASERPLSKEQQYLLIAIGRIIRMLQRVAKRRYSEEVLKKHTEKNKAPKIVLTNEQKNVLRKKETKKPWTPSTPILAPTSTPEIGSPDLEPVEKPKEKEGLKSAVKKSTPTPETPDAKQVKRRVSFRLESNVRRESPRRSESPLVYDNTQRSSEEPENPSEEKEKPNAEQGKPSEKREKPSEEKEVGRSDRAVESPPAEMVWEENNETIIPTTPTPIGDFLQEIQRKMTPTSLFDSDVMMDDSDEDLPSPSFSGKSTDEDDDFSEDNTCWSPSQLHYENEWVTSDEDEEEVEEEACDEENVDDKLFEELLNSPEVPLPADPPDAMTEPDLADGEEFDPEAHFQKYLNDLEKLTDLFRTQRESYGKDFENLKMMFDVVEGTDGLCEHQVVSLFKPLDEFKNQVKEVLDAVVMEVVLSQPDEPNEERPPPPQRVHSPERGHIIPQLPFEHRYKRYVQSKKPEKHGGIGFPGFRWRGIQGENALLAHDKMIIDKIEVERFDLKMFEEGAESTVNGALSGYHYFFLPKNSERRYEEAKFKLLEKYVGKESAITMTIDTLRYELGIDDSLGGARRDGTIDDEDLPSTDSESGKDSYNSVDNCLDFELREAMRNPNVKKPAFMLILDPTTFFNTSPEFILRKLMNYVKGIESMRRVLTHVHIIQKAFEKYQSSILRVWRDVKDPEVNKEEVFKGLEFAFLFDTDADPTFMMIEELFSVSRPAEITEMIETLRNDFMELQGEWELDLSWLPRVYYLKYRSILEDPLRLVSPEALEALAMATVSDVKIVTQMVQKKIDSGNKKCETWISIVNTLQETTDGEFPKLKMSRTKEKNKEYSKVLVKNYQHAIDCAFELYYLQEMNMAEMCTTEEQQRDYDEYEEQLIQSVEAFLDLGEKSQTLEKMCRQVYHVAVHGEREQDRLPYITTVFGTDRLEEIQQLREHNEKFDAVRRFNVAYRSFDLVYEAIVEVCPIAREQAQRAKRRWAQTLRRNYIRQRPLIEQMNMQTSIFTNGSMSFISECRSRKFIPKSHWSYEGGGKAPYPEQDDSMREIKEKIKQCPSCENLVKLGVRDASEPFTKTYGLESDDEFAKKAEQERRERMSTESSLFGQKGQSSKAKQQDVMERLLWAEAEIDSDESDHERERQMHLMDQHRKSLLQDVHEIQQQKDDDRNEKYYSDESLSDNNGDAGLISTDDECEQFANTLGKTLKPPPKEPVVAVPHWNSEVVPFSREEMRKSIHKADINARPDYRQTSEPVINGPYKRTENEYDRIHTLSRAKESEYMSPCGPSTSTGPIPGDHPGFIFRNSNKVRKIVPMKPRKQVKPLPLEKEPVMTAREDAIKSMCMYRPLYKLGQFDKEFIYRSMDGDSQRNFTEVVRRVKIACGGKTIHPSWLN